MKATEKFLAPFFFRRRLSQFSFHSFTQQLTIRFNFLQFYGNKFFTVEQAAAAAWWRNEQRWTQHEKLFFHPRSHAAASKELTHFLDMCGVVKKTRKRRREAHNSTRATKKIFQDVWVRAQKNRLNKFFTFSFFHMINFFRRAHSSSLIISLLQSLLSRPATWANIFHFPFFKQEWKEGKKVLFSFAEEINHSHRCFW